MRQALSVAATASLLAACASLATPNVSTEATALRSGDYTLDTRHASLIFKINHLGFSDYVGRFERFDASLDFDATAPEAARVDAIIDMTSLDTANDEFAETLMGPNWFDAAVHPQAVFHSTSVKRTGDNKGLLEGALTLHGVTQPVTLDVTFNGGAQDILRGTYVVGFSAHGTINRDDFGVDRFDGVIADEVKIEIEAEFEKS